MSTADAEDSPTAVTGARELTDVSSLGLPPVPALTILWHPELDRVGEVAPLTGLRETASANVGRYEPTFFVPGANVGRAPVPFPKARHAHTVAPSIGSHSRFSEHSSRHKAPRSLPNQTTRELFLGSQFQAIRTFPLPYPRPSEIQVLVPARVWKFKSSRPH